MPETCDRLILSATLFLIVFSPLAYGGVDGWAVSLIRVVAAFMLCTCIVKAAYLRNFRLIYPPFWLPALLLLALFVLQLLPMPAPWRIFLSPEPLRHSILLPSSPPLVQKLAAINWSQLSIYPAATWDGLLDLLTCLALSWVLLNTLGSLREVRFIIGTLIAVGVFEAAYGLAEYWSGRQGIFWFSKVYYRDDVSGTYINHNHFAGLMAMLLPLAIGALWIEQQQEHPTSPYPAGRPRLPRRALALAGAIVVMGVALVLSHSRGGLISCAISMTWLAIMLWRRRRLGKSYRAFGIGVAVLVFAIALSFGREIATRFSYTIRDAPERLGLWEDCLKIARDFPLFGTGLGTFRYVLPNYRSKLDFLEVEGVSRQAIWNFAHNDYLQLLVECGMVGFFLAGWAMIRTIEWTYGRWQQKPEPEREIWASSAWAGVLAILLHSFVDFNLHIPANALVFTTLVSLMLVCRNSSNLPQANLLA